jgi:hypothetical protein
MTRKALFGAATVLLAVLALPSGCDDTRRDWDVCHSEPCQVGFFCNARQRCEPVDAGSAVGRPDGSVDAGDAAIDGDAYADAASDTGNDAFLDGADAATDAGAALDVDASSVTDGPAD